MAVAQINYFNTALEKESSFIALLPDRCPKPGPYPVYYLLHGLSDNETAWLRWSSIERYVRDLPLIVVLPDGDRRWYSDWPDGTAYGRAITESLIPTVDRMFQTVAAREGRALGGLSMGGYGSMKLALQHPDMFCSVVSHSGAYSVVREGNFGIPAENCPFTLAESLDRALTPAIRFDCGVDDFLIQHNRDFDAHLTALGIPHEYEEFPGEHTWDYWDEHVQEAIAFHCKALGIARG
jgi:putative tributyrin esterase